MSQWENSKKNYKLDNELYVKSISIWKIGKNYIFSDKVQIGHGIKKTLELFKKHALIVIKGTLKTYISLPKKIKILIVIAKLLDTIPNMISISISYFGIQIVKFIKICITIKFFGQLSN